MTNSRTSNDEQPPVAGQAGSWPVGLLIFGLSIIMSAILAIPVFTLDLLGGGGFDSKRLDMAIVCGIMAAFFEFFLRRRKHSENKEVHRVVAVIYTSLSVLLIVSLAIW